MDGVVRILDTDAITENILLGAWKGTPKIFQKLIMTENSELQIIFGG